MLRFIVARVEFVCYEAYKLSRPLAGRGTDVFAYGTFDLGYDGNTHYLYVRREADEKNSPVGNCGEKGFAPLAKICRRYAPARRGKGGVLRKKPIGLYSAVAVGKASPRRRRIS